MEPRIIIKPAFTVVGFPWLGESQESSKEDLWEQLSARFQEIPNADPDIGFGVHCWNGSEQRYIAGLAVRGVIKEDEVPEGMTIFQFNKHAYVVFPHYGSIDRLSTTINWFFEEWLPGSAYQSKENYYFERYDDSFQPESENSVLFVFMPVEER